MSFEDELRGVIQSAREERRKRGDEAFEEHWQSVRDSWIDKIFTEAKAAFQKENVEANTDRPNGSISLAIGRNIRDDSWRFVFRLDSDPQDQKVLCSGSALNFPPVSYDLDHLTPEVVERELKRFARAAVKNPGRL